MGSHFEYLTGMYFHAPIQKLYPGTEIVIRKGEAQITMPVQKDHLHAAGAMHGSVYFRLLDDSAFFAANSLVEDVFVLTSQFNVQLIRPCSGGRLTAFGKVISITRQSVFAESVLMNSREKVIAKGSGIFLKSNIPLNSEIGYGS